MPSINDKLKAEERNERTVRLWPEGMFFKAYERSAYLFVSQVPFASRAAQAYMADSVAHRGEDIITGVMVSHWETCGELLESNSSPKGSLLPFKLSGYNALRMVSSCRHRATRIISEPMPVRLLQVRQKVMSVRTVTTGQLLKVPVMTTV